MKSALPVLLAAIAAIGTPETNAPPPHAPSSAIAWTPGATTAFDVFELATLANAERNVDASLAAQPGAFIAKRDDNSVLAALGLILLILLLIGLAASSRDPEGERG